MDSYKLLESTSLHYTPSGGSIQDVDTSSSPGLPGEVLGATLGWPRTVPFLTQPPPPGWGPSKGEQMPGNGYAPQGTDSGPGVTPRGPESSLRE